MTAPVCPSCAYYNAAIHKEVRRNERRVRNGQPPRLSVIDGFKADRAECESRGHHDVMAGPRASSAARSA
jgi:hypothetical protein